MRNVQTLPIEHFSLSRRLKIRYLYIYSILFVQLIFTKDFSKVIEILIKLVVLNFRLYLFHDI